MRIAFITEIWHPSVNGIVTRLDRTIQELHRLGHEILVVAPRGAKIHPLHGGSTEPSEPTTPRPTVRRVPAFSISWVYGGQPWGYPTAPVGRFLDEFRPDLVHVVSPFTLGIAGVLAAKRRHLPLVCSFHTDIAAYANFYHLGWSRGAIWAILRALHNAARLNLVTSEHSMRLLSSHGVKRVELWQRGVDVERFRPPESPPASSTGLPVAVYVGRIAHEKALGDLLPLARSGTVRLVLVGDGPDRQRLEAEFAGTDTVFTGTLLGEDLVRAYANADVFVFPSTTETLGLVLLEALASGLPVVAASSPASIGLLVSTPVARLVREGNSHGFISAVAEVLASADPGELSRLARAEAQGWSWEAATAQLLQFYDRVLRVDAADTPTTSTR